MVFTEDTDLQSTLSSWYMVSWWNSLSLWNRKVHSNLCTNRHFALLWCGSRQSTLSALQF